jgi:hypothetical protein
MNLIAILLPALMPGLLDGVKGLFQRLFGGTKPVTVAEQVTLMAAENERLKALSELDRPYGEVSRWVADLRASFRYLASALILVSTFVTVLLFFYVSVIHSGSQSIPVLAGVVDFLLQLSASVFSFLFGDRIYTNLKSIIPQSITKK